MQSLLRFLAGLLQLLALVPRSCSAYTILAVPMFARNSPSLDVAAVAGELQLRGHRIMTITLPAHLAFLADAFSRHQPPPASADAANASGHGGKGPLDFITFDSASPAFEDVVGVQLQEAAKGGLPNPFKLGPTFIATQAGPCLDLVENATLMQELRDASPDLVLTYEMPMGVNLCGCVLSHALELPLVVADGIPLLSGPLSVPQFKSGLTPQDLRTIPGFLRNLVAFAIGNTLLSVAPRLAGPGNGWAAARAAAGLGHPHKHGGCAPALHLHLQSFLLEWPRPLPPGHVMLGPTSPRLPHSPAHQQQSQPQVWEALQSADPDAGVVLVGIGGSSRLFGHALTLADWRAIAGALSDLAPARVIWAMKFTDTISKEELPLGPNVLVVPWVDYNDVLGHPATRLFISHCGVHSMYEAAFHGVPVLALPFTPDQGECAVRFTQTGVGLAVPEAVAFRSSQNPLVFQRDKLVEMANQIMSNTSYRDGMQILSRQLQQQYKLRTPGQRAADEVEMLLAGRAASTNTGRGAHLGDTTGQVHSSQQLLDQEEL